MQNLKFLEDIKRFPGSLLHSEVSYPVDYNGVKYDRVLLCGMGGSSLYVDIINNYLRYQLHLDFQIEVLRESSIPIPLAKNSLYIVASHSGNTEESLECLAQLQRSGMRPVVITAGGKLLSIAQEAKLAIAKLPTGMQPRLATGYFIAALCNILDELVLDDAILFEVSESGKKLKIDEERARALANSLKGKVPIIYSTEENWSIARISKIKFNESSKVQAFWSSFPEVDHNELVGFNNVLIPLSFIIFKSKFTSTLNKKRIETFAKIMRDKSLPVEIYEMKGDTLLEEIFDAYYFIDHVSYYLAGEYGIDPEPVELVESFKKLMGQEN